MDTDPPAAPPRPPILDYERAPAFRPKHYNDIPPWIGRTILIGGLLPLLGVFIPIVGARVVLIFFFPVVGGVEGLPRRSRLLLIIAGLLFLLAYYCCPA